MSYTATVSPTTSGLPLINTPSIATSQVGVVSLVMLSVLLKPLSLAAIRSGAPGAPGTRVSMIRVSVPVETALSPLAGSLSFDCIA